MYKLIYPKILKIQQVIGSLYTTVVSRKVTVLVTGTIGVFVFEHGVQRYVSLVKVNADSEACWNFDTRKMNLPLVAFEQKRGEEEVVESKPENPKKVIVGDKEKFKALVKT